MKKYAIYLKLCLGYFLSSQSLQCSQEAQPENEKPKVVIFASEDGGGSASLAHALSALLSDKYEVTIAYILEECLEKIAGNELRALYNKEPMPFLENLAQKNGMNTLGMLTHLVVKMGVRKRLMEVIAKHLDDAHTIMAISLLPAINSAAMSVVKKKKIPLLIVAGRSRLTHWFTHIEHPMPDQIGLLLAFKSPKTDEDLRKVRWTTKYVKYAGFPLRPQFKAALQGGAPHGKDDEDAVRARKVQAKKALAIDPRAFTLLMMLGNGQEKRVTTLMQLLAQDHFQGHLLVAVGDDEALIPALEKIPLPEEMKVTYIKYTPDMAKYMVAADGLVIKAGTSTFYEALYLGVPIIIDAVEKHRDREDATLHLVDERMLGEILKKDENFTSYVSDLQNVSYIPEKFRVNMSLYQATLPHFEEIFSNMFEALLTDMDKQRKKEARQQEQEAEEQRIRKEKHEKKLEAIAQETKARLQILHRQEDERFAKIRQARKRKEAAKLEKARQRIARSKAAQDEKTRKEIEEIWKKHHEKLRKKKEAQEKKDTQEGEHTETSPKETTTENDEKNSPQKGSTSQKTSQKKG